MAQLNQILWSNITWGACGIFFLCLFGIAIKFEWNSQLTPKAWNRPRNVLKNVLKRHKIFGCINFYPFTWCIWAARLSYPQAMEGIPGTGTRDDGWSGPTMKMNLDGIILLKFHKMLFKIGIFASLLACGILLPVYTSSVCDPLVVGERECQRLASLTDFENLTISYVPEVRISTEGSLPSNATNNNWWDEEEEREGNNDEDGTDSAKASGSRLGFLRSKSSGTAAPTQAFLRNNNNKPQLIDEDGNIIIPPEPIATQHTANSKWVPGISWRHLTTAVCSVLIYAYTCYLLWHEWIDNLALRRVYFLESDHYVHRMQELDDIANLQTKPEDPVIAKRPPFVPHPEMREVPPNVSLYSVLYQLPVSLLTFDTDGATQMDRQLVATVRFFNECVPAQPGYTSSVVAATIIPDAARVAKCWTKWYRMEKKVRMVRYIRKILLKKQQKLEEGTTDIYDDVKQALKNSNHSMKTVAQRAYRRVSRTASAALKNNGSSMDPSGNMETNSTTTTLEMTSLVGEHTEEKIPLVSPGSFPHVNENGRDNSPAVETNPLPGSDAETLEAFGSGISFAAGEEVGDEDKAGSDVDGGFWQNFFGGNRSDGEAAIADDRDRIQHDSEEFLEGSFVGDDSATDIETKGSQSLELDQSMNSSLDRRDISRSSSGKFCGALTHGFKYEDYDVKQYAKTVSHGEESELIDIVDGLGIEELSVFAREYAQSSSSPCPLGCFPNSLKFLDMDELREIEESLWAEIKILNEELIEARENVIKLDDDFEVEPTMISSAAFDNDDQTVGSQGIDESISNDSDILFDSPSSRKTRLCKLRNRAAVTTNHQQWEKAKEVAKSMKEIIPQTTFPKRISVVFKPIMPPIARAFASCGGRYNPCFKETLNSLPKYYGQMKGAGRAFVTALDHPSYAVVTFSSRQAAIAARQCLADGGANNSWQQIDEIPIPPLADAPPRNILFCRGCCRPVTLTINYKEKKCRRWSIYLFMLFFCCFYTIPLAFISLLLNPRWLVKFFPNSRSLNDPDNVLYRALAGPASGLCTTLFMALLPQIFKLVAYSEGTSSSLEMAERKALLFMWYFMLITAFFGQYLATMLIQWYYHAGVTHITQSLWSTVNTVATLIPSHIAPQWLNWIIIRYGFIWPGGYFFQMNTFLTKISGLTCLNRVARGGGAGGPTPYRIYVDSGIVLLCIVGLSPMVPIVAPIATIYFIVVQPMLRWLLIFVYRPRYDTGGEMWPLCHQIVISSLIMAQILTSVTLALKGSLGGAVLVGCCTFPTFMFGLWTEERFLRPYKDTALLQTSRLDGGQESYNESQREEFRRWLVDCHKASYVPTCLLGSKENLLTVEPAVVIPKDLGNGDEVAHSVTNTKGPKRRRQQKGGIYHRKDR